MHLKLPQLPRLKAKILWNYESEDDAREADLRAHKSILTAAVMNKVHTSWDSSVGV